MIETTLAARDKTHGSFAENARVSQGLKLAFRSCPGYGALSDVQREAIDVIALKLSRILSGNPSEPDHWHDIAGYATLAEREIRNER